MEMETDPSLPSQPQASAEIAPVDASSSSALLTEGALAGDTNLPQEGGTHHQEPTSTTPTPSEIEQSTAVADADVGAGRATGAGASEDEEVLSFVSAHGASHLPSFVASSSSISAAPATAATVSTLPMDTRDSSIDTTSTAVSPLPPPSSSPPSSLSASSVSASSPSVDGLDSSSLLSSVLPSADDTAAPSSTLVAPLPPISTLPISDDPSQSNQPDPALQQVQVITEEEVHENLANGEDGATFHDDNQQQHQEQGAYESEGDGAGVQPPSSENTSDGSMPAPAAGPSEEEPQGQQVDASVNNKPPRGSEVFVGGLTKDVNEADLYALFASVGEIHEIRLMKDSTTGESKGYGFVRFTSPKFAKLAVQQIDGAMLKGRKIGVVHSNDNQTLFLGHLDKDWRQEQLEQHLREAKIKGVVAITLMKDTASMRGNRGFAFVEFGSHEEAAKAHAKIMKAGFRLGNVEVKVDWAEPLNEPSEEVMSKVKSIYVCNLPVTVDDELIKQVFGEFGEIERIVLSKNLKSARRDDFAFINYTEREHALAAIEARNGYKIDDDHILDVTLAKPVSEQEKQTGKQTGRREDHMGGRGTPTRSGHRGGGGFGGAGFGRGAGDFAARGGYRDHHRGGRMEPMMRSGDRRGGRGGRGGREWEPTGFQPQTSGDFRGGRFDRPGRRHDRSDAYPARFGGEGMGPPLDAQPPTMPFPPMGNRGGFGFRGGHRGGAVATTMPPHFSAEPPREYDPHGSTRKRRFGEDDSTRGGRGGAGAGGPGFQRTTRRKPDEAAGWPNTSMTQPPLIAQPLQQAAPTWGAPTQPITVSMAPQQQPLYRPPTAPVVAGGWQQPSHAYIQPQTTQTPIYVGFTQPTTAYSAAGQQAYGMPSYAHPQQTAYATPQASYTAALQQPAYPSTAVSQQPAVYAPAAPQQAAYPTYAAQPYPAVQSYVGGYPASAYYATGMAAPTQASQGQQRTQQ